MDPELAGTLATLTALIGLAVLFIGWFATVREMFAESRAYGYGAFLLPLLPLIYAALHWEDLKRPFWIQLAGYGLVGASILLRSLAGAN